ncbi:L-threonine 3-dehydrogenase [Alkalibacterium pelagium]|uniref:Nucleoside-diphosphate-sugar epimerase n=1 Tax=Alkalibacterium pelagium TaxID=426702 RepID=A0A1H7EW78_9LACT|nr:L-threonine 3-dehydrogenase [Alkalibacterium pelagium]GEN49593.1 L-threonine 3-dehydrogenase [Alkalibacterium pelagium]SEK18156.1 Nucleoside-diphosphate-sugar epimerase [Alkalibacterium pelagium]
MKKIIITGALGQIGSELTIRLREVYGKENVIATDIRQPEDSKVVTDGIFEILDVTDADHMKDLVEQYEVDTFIHLAALLSAVAEAKPQLAWDLNMGGLINALELSREYDLKFFTPSSIGAFGPQTPKDQTPQVTIQRPTTMYGVTKVSGELLGDYYFQKFGVDTRSVRFPGLISYDTLPGGGTTDYAVDIYYEALKNNAYTSFIDKGTYMDMMYMPDAVDLIIQLMEAPSDQLVNRNAYNVSAMSIAPEDVEKAIQKHLPDFKLSYDVDPVRQGIAESWPNAIDTTAAQEEWGFSPKYDLEKMTEDMLKQLKNKGILSYA